MLYHILWRYTHKQRSLCSIKTRKLVTDYSSYFGASGVCCRQGSKLNEVCRLKTVEVVVTVIPHTHTTPPSYPYDGDKILWPFRQLDTPLFQRAEEMEINSRRFISRLSQQFSIFSSILFFFVLSPSILFFPGEFSHCSYWTHFLQSLSIYITQ